MSQDETQLRVGQRLKARRQAIRLSLAQVEIDTKIRGKFLTALESGEYESLPNDVYARGFVQHYANHLGLDGAAIAAEYVAERGGISKGETKGPQLVRPKRLVFTGRIVAVLGGLALIAGVLGYLLWQFSALAAPPQLTVTSPEADTAITGAVIEVTGKATPGTDVSVNDSSVLTDTDGNFSEKVALQNGVNAIRIAARSKLGKMTGVTRNVLAKLPKVDAADVLPTAPFAGVAVQVTASRAASVVVQVDGGDAVEMLVPAGWTKVYKGAKSVVLSTNDAGAVAATVTNSTVAGKVLAPLGGNGEVRKNQAFAIDTAFQ